MKVRYLSIFIGFSIILPFLFSVIVTPVNNAVMVEDYIDNLKNETGPKTAIGGIGEYYIGNGNSLNLDLLESGDIILMMGVIAGSIEILYPDQWTHAALYVGDVDSDGKGELIEGWGETPGQGSGARIIDVDNVLDTNAAGIYRVNFARAGLLAYKDQIIADTIAWALSKEGVDYDSELVRKMISHFPFPRDAVKERDGTAYTCGELVWAAYMHGSDDQIDIDKNDDGWNWRYEYAVNNNEIADDPLVDEITISRF